MTSQAKAQQKTYTFSCPSCKYSKTGAVEAEVIADAITHMKEHHRVTWTREDAMKHIKAK